MPMTFSTSEERNNHIESLKKEYFASIEHITPETVKKGGFFNLDEPGEISITLTKEMVETYELEKWLANYKKEAQHSTGGIRGPQNVLYYWDHRFPINQLGVALATLGKSLVLKDTITDREIHKAVSGEVRYNTKKYIELISRIHAAQGIYTHQTPENQTTAIWLVSFLIFMNDYDGGEFVTSSHAISSKTATKDLESQGSQFLPEMSLAFIAKIEDIIRQAKESPEGYTIKLAPRKNAFTVSDLGAIEGYADYLRNGIATEQNIKLIQDATAQGMRLMYETVGGCMHRTMVPLLKNFGILEAFEWNNPDEDPFFHGVGKTHKLNPKTGKEEFFDLSCDACLPEVVETMGYPLSLIDKPLGYVILITDPDGDRLVVGQVDTADHIPLMEELGIGYIRLSEDKIVAVYHPTFSFLMIMDFYMKQLRAAGKWDSHPRFMINTTPSSRAWDEWAKTHGVHILSVPVGFKEIATILKKVEKKLFAHPDQPVVVNDIWRNDINIGVDPRLIFAGEESGGMIIGPEDPITTRGGRRALAMREKSAGEASIIASALAAHLHLNKKSLAEYLQEIFTECKTRFTFYERADITYYNESEPDPAKLLAEKSAGETLRDTIDLYYLGLALGLKEGLVNIGDIRQILSEAMPSLDFSTLTDVRFTGDATYIEFDGMFVQIRKSGTDAKLRGYSNGEDKKKCLTYLDTMVHYNGAHTKTYTEKIPTQFVSTIYDKTKLLYDAYLYTGL